MKFTTFVLIVVLCLLVGKSQQENQLVEMVSDFFGGLQTKYFAVFNPQQISDKETFEIIVELVSYLKETDHHCNNLVTVVNGFRKTN